MSDIALSWTQTIPLLSGAISSKVGAVPPVAGLKRYPGEQAAASRRFRRVILIRVMRRTEDIFTINAGPAAVAFVCRGDVYSSHTLHYEGLVCLPQLNSNSSGAN